MDFNSLGENSPVYIVRKRPFRYEVGTLKSKGTKQPTLGTFIPQATPQPLDIVVNVGGNDEILPNVPLNMEVLEYKNSYYSVSTEGIQRAVASMMQVATSNLNDKEYYESVLSEGERVMERLNPQYAEGKRQARTIKDLQSHVSEQDKKLDEILTFMRDLSGKPKK